MDLPDGGGRSEERKDAAVDHRSREQQVPALVGVPRSAVWKPDESQHSGHREKAEKDDSIGSSEAIAEVQ
jgi:hypothetical protein